MNSANQVVNGCGSFLTYPIKALAQLDSLRSTAVEAAVSAAKTVPAGDDCGVVTLNTQPSTISRTLVAGIEGKAVMGSGE
jgi:hypothetical protein